MSVCLLLVLLLLGISCACLGFKAIEDARFQRHIESEMKRLHGDYRKFDITHTGPIETFELEVEIKEPK